MRMINEEKVDAKKIIKDLADTDFSGSNKEQGKMAALIKGLAFSDEVEANTFMKALDNFTTNYGKKSDKKESIFNEATEIYSVLRTYFPDAAEVVGKISTLLEGDIEGALSFCLHLLEDVNVHKEMLAFDESIVVKGSGELLDLDEENNVELEEGQKYFIQKVIEDVQ